MAELEEVEIEMMDFNTRKYKGQRAALSQEASCNIIERACLEGLGRPWTRSDSGIIYDFSEHASPPLGRSELRWCWKGCSATASAIFIVVEKIEGTTCGIMLGPSGRQKPVVPTSNDTLTFTMLKRTKEEQQEHRERVRLAVLRRADEKAKDEARIKEGWEKKRREGQEAAGRAKLA